MVERTKGSADAGDFFTSQTNFILEEGLEVKRKIRRQRGGRPRAKPVRLTDSDLQIPQPNQTPLDHEEIPTQNDELKCCPGCGSEVDEGKFVEAILSFTTGASDYLIGEPVRTQAIQSLKQQAKTLNLPEPADDWLLEICARLELQTERIIEAKHDLIRQDVEENLRRELVGELYEHIRTEIETQIRAEVERDLWQQFEELYRHKLAEE